MNQELIKKVRDLTELNKSQEVVIKHVYQELTDKRDLFASETQRMHQQNQQLQAEMQRLQAELLRVQNQLASHQQTSEQQLTSLTTRLNMSRQEQVRNCSRVLSCVPYNYSCEYVEWCHET